MKKILTSIIAAAALCGAAQAAPEQTYSVDTASMLLVEHPDTTLIYHADKTTPVSGYSGYIATYWFGGNNPANLQLVGASVFADVTLKEVMLLPEWADYAGTLMWEINPDDVTTFNNQTNYFAIRIFYAPELAASFDPLWDPKGVGEPNQWSKLDYDKEDLENAWATAWDNYENALTPYEIGDFRYTQGMDGLGNIMPISVNRSFLDGADEPGKYFLLPNPVPEPSTWLLLGAGAAFALILRRRRK